MPKIGYKQSSDHKNKLSMSRRGIKKPGTSEYMKKNNPMKRMEVREKFIGAKNPSKRSDVREKIRQAKLGRKRPDISGEYSPSKRPETRAKMLAALQKHHIYMKENSDEVIYMTNSKHSQLHSKAYAYIYHKYGKEGIDDYLTWFNEKYQLE